ncbi:MAG TPA: response regulator [Pyrinomonadaceae bacterium]
MSSSVKPERYPPTQEEEEDYVPLPLLRVLLLDDNHSVRQSLGDDLRDDGYVVNCAETTAEALRFLREHPYQVIFVDVNLLPYDPPGDLFIIDNQHLMAGATVVAITAQDILQKIGHARQVNLTKIGVRILTKGSPHFSDELRAIVGEKMRSIRAQLLNFRDRLYGVSPEADPPPSQEQQLLDSLREFLVDWLRTRKNSDKRNIYYGGKLLSMDEIAGEIESGTEIGRAHVKMIVSLFKRVMGAQG